GVGGGAGVGGGTSGTGGGTAGTTGPGLYYAQGFEICPPGWTFSGDWQCGTPTSGPNAAHTGTGVLATVLSGNYSYDTTASWTRSLANSPAISLAGATAPALQFWAYLDSETAYDGFNIKVSTDN